VPGYDRIVPPGQFMRFELLNVSPRLNRYLTKPIWMQIGRFQIIKETDRDNAVILGSASPAPLV
jgi:hypothetical protein